MSRTAIIAVHGVADQKPGETARSVAALLHAYSSENGGYEPFVEEQLVLPVRKLPDLPSRSKKTIWGRLDPFFELIPYLRTKSGRAHDPPGEASLEFMADQVRDYDPSNPEAAGRDNVTYQSIRLTSRSRESDKTGHPRESMDVYEMFWADQSRLGSGAFQVLVSFFQLIFHVCSLGRNTLDFALVEYPDSKALWMARAAHAVVSFGLTLIAPILNLCLLATLSLVVPAKIPDNLQWFAAIGGALAIGASGIVAALLKRDGREKSDLVTRSIWIGGIALSLILMVEVVVIKGAALRLLSLEWLIFASVAVMWVIDQYSQAKPQARIIGAICGVSILVYVLTELFRNDSTHDGIAMTAIRSAMVVFISLELIWIIVGVAIIFAAGATLMGIDFGKSGAGTKLRRSLGTAFVSLMLPASLFIVVTIMLYTPLLYLATPTDSVQSTTTDRTTIVSSDRAESAVGKGFLVLPDIPFNMPWAKSTFFWTSPQMARKFPWTLRQVPEWLFLVTVTLAFPQILCCWGIAAGVAVW